MFVCFVAIFCSRLETSYPSTRIKPSSGRIEEIEAMQRRFQAF